MRIDPTTRAITYVPGFGAHAGQAPVNLTNGGGDLLVLRESAGIVELDASGGLIRTSKTPIPSAQAITVGGGSIWVLTQPSSTAPSQLEQLDETSLRRVRAPIQVGMTATGLAADSATTWVAAGGDLTRIDVRPEVSRPELCPGSTPWERGIADGLPAVASAVTDLTVADRALRATRSTLMHEYTGAVSVTVGPGYGRAWVQDSAGRVTVVAVADYALIVHLRSKRDCPTGGTMPVGNATSDNVPVLLAGDGDRSRTSRSRLDPSLNRPEAMAVDRSGRPLIWNQGTHQILRLRTDNQLEVVAGNGTRGDRGDGARPRRRVR